jgi:HAD superfamily hydrolase (TIGR01484 family)
MRPLSLLGTDEAKNLHGLLFDLDDTLLDHGRLTERAYSALFRLGENGMKLLAVTGRPAGWGEVIVRQWPIDGAITENGSIALYRDGESIRRIDPADEHERRVRRMRVAEVVAEIRERFPELHAADDTGLRWSDFAFDIGEHFHVAPEVVHAVAELVVERGAKAWISSVHLHVSFDRDDKASGSVRVLRTLFGEDPTLARFRYAYIGDSENDAASFAAFRTSFGVANFRGRPTVSPRYRSSEPRGAGFAEVAARLIELRRAG